MTVIIGVILSVFVLLAIVWIVIANRKKGAASGLEQDVEVQANLDPACCGAHEVCEFDAVKADPSIIEYFDDEELDQLAGADPAGYSDVQIDQLREVLYTLNTHEIRNWLLSIERRNIVLPAILIQEARELQAG